MSKGFLEVSPPSNEVVLTNAERANLEVFLGDSFVESSKLLVPVSLPLFRESSVVSVDSVVRGDSGTAVVREVSMLPFCEAVLLDVSGGAVELDELAC